MEYAIRKECLLKMRMNSPAFIRMVFEKHEILKLKKYVIQATEELVPLE